MGYWTLKHNEGWKMGVFNSEAQAQRTQNKQPDANEWTVVYVNVS